MAVASGVGTSVEVTPVTGFRELREFVELPFRLHAHTPWIPPLKLERYVYLSRRLNPFYKHGDAELFVARREGRVVGRISAQIDRNFNDFHANRWGLFGFLEFEDDQEILDALLAAAESWLRERGRDRMVGPMDFVMNEECGVLIEGHELEPMIRQPWHPPYYRGRVEAAGLEKAMDVLHWHLELAYREEGMLPTLPKLSARCHEHYGVTIRPLSWLHLRRELNEFAKVYNAAWSHNWGFVPYSREDLDDLAITYRLIYDRHWFMAAELDGKTIAIALTFPDINVIYKKMKGRLLPFGWWHYLVGRRGLERCRVGFLGVLPEYRHTGVAAALYMAHFDAASVTAIEWGEAGWILETNSSMNRGLEAMGGHIAKRCRIYERRFEAGAEPAAPPELREQASAPPAGT